MFFDKSTKVIQREKDNQGSMGGMQTNEADGVAQKQTLGREEQRREDERSLQRNTDKGRLLIQWNRHVSGTTSKKENK